MANISMQLTQAFTEAKKQILANLVQEQNDRLVEYAKQIISLAVQTKTFGNRTLNLVDSYVWALWYNNKLIDSGFYTPNAQATKKTKMFNGEKVDGRKLANKFIKKFKHNNTGWHLVIAATAPYGTYLENARPTGTKFFVLSQVYDTVKSDLEGAFVEFKIDIE